MVECFTTLVAAGEAVLHAASIGGPCIQRALQCHRASPDRSLLIAALRLDVFQASVIRWRGR